MRPGSTSWLSHPLDPVARVSFGRFVAYLLLSPIQGSPVFKNPVSGFAVLFHSHNAQKNLLPASILFEGTRLRSPGGLKPWRLIENIRKLEDRHCRKILLWKFHSRTPPSLRVN